MTSKVHAGKVRAGKFRTSGVYGRVAAACLAALLISPLWLSAAEAQEQHRRSSIVVDGDMWMKSTPEVRKAFLVGAGNMLAMERAYAQKKGTPPPVAGTIAAKAVEGMTLDQISNRITRWYESNPDRRNTPVMGAIWFELVDPGADKKK